MINEFEDVSAFTCMLQASTPNHVTCNFFQVSHKEKQFMVLWNSFVHQRHVYADYEVHSTALLKFVVFLLFSRLFSALWLVHRGSCGGR
jgi:hypothetical protein